MSEKIFAGGMIAKAPKQGLPDFIKGHIAVRREEAIKWLQSFDDIWLNLDMKESRAGTYYLELNTWKPEQTDQKATGDAQAEADYEAMTDPVTSPGYDGETMDSSSIPF